MDKKLSIYDKYCNEISRPIIKLIFNCYNILQIVINIYCNVIFSSQRF